MIRPLRKSPSGGSDALKLLLACVFIALVFLPLARMFAFMDADSLAKVASSPLFGQAVVNSLVSALIATAITVMLAFALALCIRRTDIRCKSLFGVIFTLPMLIPSISSGMGLVILFGNNGILTRGLGLEGNIYGLWGIVTGSVMYAFPVAYLMLSDVIGYEDGSPYEAARVLGIPGWRQFTAILLPYLRKSLINVVFATFTMIITDYGVPLMVGGKYTTVATVLYQEVIGQLNFGRGTVYGALLLIPALAAFCTDLMNKDRGNAGFVTRPCPVAKSSWIRFPAYCLCTGAALFTLLPIGAFLLLTFARDYPGDLTLTFANVARALKLRAGDYLLNSVIIALSTAALGTIIAFAAAYLSARMKSPTSRFLHLAAMTSAAIPGVVLGLAYVLTFRSTAMYGTIAILVMVNIVHFLSSPYLMMYNSLSKINGNLEGVAQTLGVSRPALIRDVLIPQCRETLAQMFTHFFVNAMMTISAVSFLASTASKPVSLMITQFEAQMQLECAAVVSLMILCTNIAMKLAARALSRPRRR